MYDDDDVVVSAPAKAGLSAVAEPGTGIGEAAAEEVSASRAADSADSAPSTSGALGFVRRNKCRRVYHRLLSLTMCVCGRAGKAACKSAATAPLPAARQRPCVRCLLPSLCSASEALCPCSAAAGDRLCRICA